MELCLRHVVVCRFAQETRYAVPCPTLSFTFAGLEFHESPGFRLAAGATGLLLTPQGLPIHFRFNDRRENYAVLFDSNDVRPGAAPDRVELRQAGEWLSVPAFVPVDAGRLDGWRLELERIRTAFLMPTAKNRLRAELGVLNLLRQLVDETPAATGVSPAEQLKNLIDADSAGRRTTDELCAACRYSPDHLRLLFTKEFGVTPKQYRMRRRMAEAMEWIAGSRLSAKEIAGRLGFAQSSHFSAAFRAAHGLPPREAIRRFRRTGEQPPPPTGRREGATMTGPACCPDLQ
ncbi:MAG: AraC family transcriptional regulator [Lentisphaeria bacterium]